MGLSEIADIVLLVACVVFVGINVYLKAKGNVFAAVSDLIAWAESMQLTGPEKMFTVVGELYDKVPGFVKSILTREVLQKIAQGVYNSMKKYAERRAENDKKESEFVCTEDYCIIPDLEPEDYDAPGTNTRETGV